jgi:hypothetical protein
VRVGAAFAQGPPAPVQTERRDRHDRGEGARLGIGASHNLNAPFLERLKSAR